MSERTRVGEVGGITVSVDDRGDVLLEVPSHNYGGSFGYTEALRDDEAVALAVLLIRATGRTPER